ncbi:MAG: carboxypeptidase-like regulatory domain-containing protein [Alistipes sp.]|nr:carboxypeptidase-like regulatory domain-containing protein [Alistipes sp.]
MSGRVFEESTDPLRPRPQGLVGAVVSVEGKVDTLHTTTDYDGNFYFKRVPTGVVRVRVSFLGYETQTMKIADERGRHLLGVGLFSFLFDCQSIGAAHATDPVRPLRARRW